MKITPLSSLKKKQKNTNNKNKQNPQKAKNKTTNPVEIFASENYLDELQDTDFKMKNNKHHQKILGIFKRTKERS